MKNMKFWRTALVATLVLTVMLSVTGGTIAWFTDTVTSGSNIIKSGTLDVEMYWADGKEALDTAKWTDASTGAIFNYDKWEPGYVEVRHIKIANVGTLAFNYALTIDASSASKLAEAIDVYFIDNGEQIAERAALADKTPVGTLTEMLAGMPAKTSALLEKGESDVVTIALKMRESAGNEYQGLSIGDGFSVKLEATQATVEQDSFDNQYDKDAIVEVGTKEAAQAALDNAKPGDVIQLVAGVDYGTLYLRPVADTAHTKEVDWQGNNYRWETYSLFENVTIKGAEGATVDAIEIEAYTYYNTTHSQSATYPIMLSLIELKNVVIDGVTFTGNGGYDPQSYGNAINLTGYIKVDGLTLKNCVLKNDANNARLIYKTEGTTQVHTYTYGGETFTFVPSLKDITVTGCTLNGGYMGLELRETENVTITNNTFNVADRNILLPVNTGCTYSGKITITGNESNNAKERFVRAAGIGAAEMVISGNTINNYQGTEANYIKVDGGTNVTITNNNITDGKTDRTEVLHTVPASK